jgi:ABC-2 type transport system permease protein
MKIAAIVRTNLIRALRDRTALFFSVLLPLVLILVLGLTYGSGKSARIGVLDEDGGPIAGRLVTAIETSSDLTVDIRRFDSTDGLRDAAARGIVEVGVVIPAGYGDALQAGGQTSVTVVAPPTQMASSVASIVQEAIAAEAAIMRAARFSAAETGRPFDQALEEATARAQSLPGVSVTIEPVDADVSTGNGYDSGAQGQLILFMFLTSLTGATELVLTRQLGVSRRMLGTPTSIRTIVLGESLARIAFALAQGVFIVAASAILFGVRWGDPLALTAIVVAFALVAGGAAMVIGTVASNPSQAGAIGPALALLLGLVGGAMVPTEVFPAVMQQLSHLTPHAWAIEALHALGEPGTGLDAVLRQVVVLLGFAALFFAIAVTRFRRVLQSGG